MITVKTFIFNPFQQNTYLVYDETNQAIVIDAGCLQKSEKEELKTFIQSNNLELKLVINTHLHLDHQFGNKFLFDTFGLEPLACVEDEFLLESVVTQARSFGLPIDENAKSLGGYIAENEVIKFGNAALTAIHVPGHSPGSLAFYSPEGDGILFAGDVLFRGSVGRTDLPKGDYPTLINSITQKLLTLPDSTVVYCGHGSTTTIGNEKVSNPFL